MACSIAHLIEVVSVPEGFPSTRGRQTGDAAAHRCAPKQLDSNHYVYHGPQAVTVVQQPDTGNYHQIQTTNNYARWYVCPASQFSSS
ncbi:hypothetical protein HRI_003253200 [Hibiscus trionum]|uniref:Uncharacterized protein n=1 Tax=Hibiscus trionum TaxID=183268 RepID=A0A9W7MD35_HIBTR|nr:hypothetical protein HRI_003253200 [Hibiscus trionum]